MNLQPSVYEPHIYPLFKESGLNGTYFSNAQKISMTIPTATVGEKVRQTFECN
jgi:hypothetical protein